MTRLKRSAKSKPRDRRPSSPADELESFRRQFEMPLDREISYAVKVLYEAGIETSESCEGGDGHSFPEPTVQFFGDGAEGYRAVTIALQFGLPVSDLRRVWSVIGSELTGPHWEMTFSPRSRLVEVQRQAEEPTSPLRKHVVPSR